MKLPCLFRTGHLGCGSYGGMEVEQEAPHKPWQPAEPVFLAWNREKYSAAQPACAAPRPRKESRVQKFLAALEEAGYEREDNPAQAVLLRE